MDRAEKPKSFNFSHQESLRIKVVTKCNQILEKISGKFIKQKLTITNYLKHWMQKDTNTTGLQIPRKTSNYSKR